MGNKGIVPANGLSLPHLTELRRRCCLSLFSPLFRGPPQLKLRVPLFGGGVADIPHLREKGNISPHHLGPPAKGFPFSLVRRLVITTSDHLQKRHLKLSHI